MEQPVAPVLCYNEDKSLTNEGGMAVTAIKKVAVFLTLIGPEKGKSVIDLMDTGEIKTVVAAFQTLAELSPNEQSRVHEEFAALGYKESMNPDETLSVIRCLFHGSRIGGSKGFWRH